MIWNADFALFYIYALTLFGALLLWAVPMAIVSVTTSLRRAVHKRAPAAPQSAPALKSATPGQSRSQALSARFPQLMR